jgi:ribosomal protein S21
MINVEVKKNQSENVPGVMRRFTRKIQSSGILPRVRSLRYYTRTKSKNMQRRATLNTVAKRERFQDLFKLGLIKKEVKKGGRR